MGAMRDKRRPSVANKGVIASFALIAGICGPSDLWAQSTIALQGLWRVEGTPLGTERALDPYFALTNERLFISGSIETDGNRRQVIQVFDAATGGYLQTVEDPTGAVFDGLGDVIAANTDFMVTSTFREAPGALQVFDAATGEHLRGIDNPRADDSTFFGQLPIALSGDRAMAGVALSDDNQSTVWIFDLRTGEILVTIQEPDNKPGFFTDAERTIFGFDKVLTETHALISARNKSLGDDSNVGVVYLFDAKSGDLLRTFLPPDPVAGLFFGTDILLAGDTVLVTALRETGPLDWPVYEISAFDLTSGALKYTLQDPYVPQTPEDVVAGQQGSGFAFDFAVSNGLLFVGLPDLSGPNKDAVGGLHIYHVETGERVFSFENLAGVAGDNLGYGLAAAGDRLGIVSTPQTIENQFSELTRFDLFDVDQGQR